MEIINREGTVRTGQPAPIVTRIITQRPGLSYDSLVIGSSIFLPFTIHHLQFTHPPNFKKLPAILQGCALLQSLEYVKHNRSGNVIKVFAGYHGAV